MAIRFPAATRNAMVDAWAALANGGSIEIRTGSQPAAASDTATGTLLATSTLPSPAFAAAASGSAALNTVADVLAVADGTAGWARVKGSGGSTVFDGSVGTSGADFIINSTTIVTGGTVKVLSGSLTQPAG